MSNTRRAELVEAFGREGRRVGSQNLVINHFVAEKLGIGKRDWEALDILDWTGPVTSGRLAELMGVTTGAMTGIVDRLESRGFVMRVRDPEDRRKVIVEVRHEALGVAGEVYEPIVRGMEKLVAGMTIDELKAVTGFLSRFNDTLWQAIQQMGKRDA